MGSVFHGPPEVGNSAIRSVVWLIKKVASQIASFAGASSTVQDTTCDRLAGLNKLPPLVRGVVLRSGIGSYDCEVELSNGHIVVCSVITPVLSDIYGVSQASAPVPGSGVLVYVQTGGLFNTRALHGYILGVIPEGNTGGVSTKDGNRLTRIVDTDYPEGGVAQYTESGHDTIASDKKYQYKGTYSCGRPHDIVPGEYGLLNHTGAGLVIGAISTTIKGSESASVRCSSLDDQVRIVSGHFRHISSSGSEEIFNDGGFISVESSVSMYQAERLGMKSDGASALKWSPESVLSLKEVRSGVSPMKRGQTSKKRLYRYEGYLGDIVNVFVATPDPSTDIESMSTSSKNEGLFHTHVDTSGRYTMRSASGILLERYDRIPIPKRTHYAWDPAGDDPSSGGAESKKDFVVPVEYPMGIGVTLGDRAAWWDYLSYTRIRQFKKDFYLPEQKELKCPQSKYDTIGKGEQDFEKYDSRHSYIGLTPDGGIVLRDAWGSELVMADGRITLNAAANIEIRSGSSVVILGGDDVVTKAYNSVDISATKKDIRIKAEKNMQVVSNDGGILIQSKAEDMGSPADWNTGGEDLESCGVVIKADKSAVALTGKKASVQGIDSVGITSFEKGKPNGSIVLAGQRISEVATSNIIATSNGTSGILLTGESAVVCAPSVLSVGGQSAADISGNYAMVGIPVEVGSMYSSVISLAKSSVQQYLERVDWLNPFPPTIFSSVDFSFRTSEQYGTNEDSGAAKGIFSVYQPSWVLLAGKRKWMKSVKTDKWKEEPDKKGEYPWPGKAAMSGTGYVTYKEVNVTSDGIEQATKNEAQLTREAFSSYHIRETT